MNTTQKCTTGIPIAPQVTYKVGGRLLTGTQLALAIEVCIGISKTYALAEAKNGGNERIVWECLDEVAEKSDKALGERHMQEVNAWAKRANDYMPEGWNAGNAEPGNFSEDLAALAHGERKKADDTEGGACD